MQSQMGIEMQAETVQLYVLFEMQLDKGHDKI